MTKPRHPDGARRCKARSSTRVRLTPDAPYEELRCKKNAIPGALVCEKHGGAAPQVKRAARERLQDAADPAAAKLAELLDSKDEQIALQAAKALLDRSGHGPTTKQVAIDGGKLNYRIEGVDMDAV